MTKCRCKILLGSILIILNASVIALGQDELPVPPQNTTSSKILRVVQVQLELELTPDQIEKIKKIDRDMLIDIKQFRTKSLEGNTPSKKDMAEAAKIVKSKVADAERDITEGVLLDFQAKRLNQIQWRIELERIGIDRFLNEKSVSSYMGMTEKEKRDFLVKASKERIRILKEIAKLRLEMDQKVLALLPKAHQESLNKLIGDEFRIIDAAPPRSPTPATRARNGK